MAVVKSCIDIWSIILTYAFWDSVSPILPPSANIKFIQELCDNFPYNSRAFTFTLSFKTSEANKSWQEKNILYFVKSLQLLLEVSIYAFVLCFVLHWWNFSYSCTKNLLRFNLGFIKNVICICLMNNYIIFYENGEQQFICRIKQENRTYHFIEC